MLALRMQATTGGGDQTKQQETSLYSSSSDASECGSDGDESAEDSDPDGMFYIQQSILYVLEQYLTPEFILLMPESSLRYIP